jgi:hypothetical protein
MNKKLANHAKIFLLGLFFIFLFSNMVSADESNYSYSTSYNYNYNYQGIQLTFLKYEPYPANPGEYVDVWLQANIGPSVSYAKFELQQEFPFSIDSNDNPVREYTDVSGDVLIHYKVRIDQNAVEGPNTLNIKVSTDRYSVDSIVEPLEIDVANAQTNFDMVVQDYTSSALSLAIANIGENTANSVIVRIPDQTDFKVTGATNGQMVGNLNSGDYTLAGFNIVSIGRSSGSEKNLTVEIDYTDNIGVRRTLLKQVQINSPGISNYTSGAMSGNFVRGTKKSGNSYTLIGIILIILVILVFVYFKFKKQIHNSLFKKLSAKKPKTGSAEIPSWVKNFKEK